MTTMIGYEDRQVNTHALTHARGFILYLRVYGVYGTNQQAVINDTVSLLSSWPYFVVMSEPRLTDCLERKEKT